MMDSPTYQELLEERQRLLDERQHLRYRLDQPESAEIERLRLRLEEAEATIAAIRDGLVDAVVVSAPTETVYTLDGADRPYRLLVEAMEQAVAVLNPAGCVLYANGCLADLFKLPMHQLVGANVHDFVAGQGQGSWSELLRSVETAPIRRELELQKQDGSVFPAAVALSQLPLQRICLLVADLSQQKQYEELIRSKEALRDSERFLQRLTKIVPGILYIYDLEQQRPVFLSGDVTSVLGCNAAEAAEMGADFVPKLMHPDDQARFADHQRQLGTLADGDVAPFEYRMRDRGGAWHWLYSRDAVFARREDGGARQIIGTAIEITERKMAEEAVKERERRFRGIFNSTFQYTGLLSPDGTVLEVNRTALDAAGITADEVIGRPFWESPWWAHHPEERRRVHESVRRAAAGEFVRFEAKYWNKDHSDTTVDFSMSPVRDENGNVVLLVPEGRDVTDRKRAEAALRESDERLRLATGAAGLGIWMWEPAADRVTWEDELPYEIVGLPRTEEPVTAARFAAEIVHPEDRAAFEQAIAATVSAGTRLFYQGRIRRPNGEVRCIEFTGNPERGPDGVCRRVLGTIQDVTDRWLAAEELRRLAAELSEADRRKDEFLATLAHELRNPLAPIRNGLQLLRLMGECGEPGEQALNLMERQVGQMVRLIDDLMDVSRISQNKLKLRMERVNLADVLTSAIETSRPLLESMNHELKVALPAHPVVIQADLTRLAQVFMNLLNNAAKYSDPNSRIGLTAERQGSDVVVSVRDEGIGIAADQLPHIFDLFSQAPRSLDRSQGGLGIGLSLVRRLLEMHGGTITVASDGPGTGSEFTVRLPVVVDASAPPAEHRLEESGGTTCLRILVVDDNRDGADSLAMMLKVMGNDTCTACDGEQAVEVCQSFLPDVILLDIGLPKLNGYEACARIREQPLGKNLVIIAQTGWGQDEDRQRARDAGFDFHMVKPVDPQALLKLLADLREAKC